MPGSTNNILPGDRSDEDLFLACAGDEPGAFRLLVERHMRLVRRLALNVLGDVHEAEDVAQEVFVAVWRARLDWRPEARFSTWLHRVAVNKAIDRRRSLRGVSQASPEPQEVIARLADADQRAARLEGAPEDAHVRLERMESAKGLRLALERLPAAQNQALTMFYFEELDVGRIADVLDCSEQAVRSLLKRGRAALKTNLQRQKKICSHGYRPVQSQPRQPGGRS
ncbi:sigma-70 family RNA polymerase sigma factor [Caulobacter sp. CCG-8]|uniref:RNA polymerase sigma factor n=1 Tax=Caulobacter sp. CCG-8 TaxID=3127958 RepID=UPI00307E0EEB